MATVVRVRARVFDGLLAPLRLLERSRGWRRRLLIVAYGLLGLIAGFVVWWATSLNDLPDVGDPFDVEAFVDGSRVPASEDAFVLYREAVGAYRDSPIAHDWNTTIPAMRNGWEKADPKVKSWVLANRPALDLWREGTNRPGGIPEDLATVRMWARGLVDPLTYLTQAAILEGVRLEAAGDRAGALEWYLAVYRACGHYSTKSRMEWRRYATMLEMPARDRMIAWSRDPKTDAPLLRRAIAAIEEIDARTPPLSDNLKAEYLALMHGLDDLPRLARDIDRAGSSTYPYDEAPRAHHAFWFARRETSRSRRVVRLFFANWLPQADKPLLDRPKALGNHPQHAIWGYYEPGRDASPYANAIEPSKLFAWLESTAMLTRCLTMYPWDQPSSATDRQGYATMLVSLGEQLYLRETGEDLPSIGALVPRYLKAIPPYYADEKSKP